MNPKGIFEGMPDPADAGGAAPSPFKALPSDTEGADNPFSLPPGQLSPFAAAVDEAGQSAREPGRPARNPEPRGRAGAASPFQLAEPGEGFGFEAEPAGAAVGGPAFGGSPFAAAAEPPARSQFTAADGAAPGAEAPPPVPAAVVGPAPAAPPARPLQPVQQVQPVQPVQPVPAAAAVQPVRPVAGLDALLESPVLGDSSGIRQLELRAIFGIDRELSADEIVQRLRALPGIRNLARVGEDGLGAIDALRRSLAGLAQGGAQLRILLGGAPVEFIREGKVVLAVMNDGSFAPGVREKIILAARELGRMG